MRVTILGSNSAIPSHGRYPSAQLVEIGRQKLLLDCGEGTQTRLIDWGHSILKITAIAISHLHGDHVFGLPAIISTMNLQGRVKPLTLYGPTKLEEYLTKTYSFTETVLAFPIHFKPIKTNTAINVYEDEHMTILTFPLEHRIETYGYKVVVKAGWRVLDGKKADDQSVPYEGRVKLKKGENFIDEKGRIFRVEDFTSPGMPERSYAYCSDTKFSERILPWIKDVDLLYHETTYTDELADLAQERYHTTASEAAKIAKLANAKKLLIGHFSSRYRDLDLFLKQARSIFEPTELAKEGKIIEI